MIVAVLATSRSHVLYIRASHVLPIHYLHDTPITPHPSHRGSGGKVDPTSIIYMLATCQLYPTQSLQHTVYIQDHDHEGGVAGLSHIYLVGGFNHLEKYEFVNGQEDIPYMKWKIKFIFETTNQIWLIMVNHG